MTHKRDTKTTINAKVEARLQRLASSPSFFLSLPANVRESFPWVDDPEVLGPNKDPEPQPKHQKK